ncbi:hypothetical protein [Rhodopila globiformis]|uniref:hypothetical protein n=1 Tax=Rhodopila globiformis TaxID=1071 RepID=UPI0011B094B3|nr:hypothetical protein [Rhodopila globiformis]
MSSDRHTALQSVLDELNALEQSLGTRGATVRAARGLNVGSALLAASVLLDSAVEHYRGSFKNRAMYTPLVVSSLSLAMNAHGTTDREPETHHARQAVAATTALTGMVGLGFHLYNVTKRPGRLAWQNLFYGAPLGAPMAILLAGLLGTAAEQVRDNPRHGKARLFGLPAGRMLAGLSGLGLLGTTAEAALLHFRGAFQNPAMYTPVTLPPIAAGLLLNTALAPKRPDRWFTRMWLWLTAGMGGAGVLFHSWGIHRAMGGWHNWKQNVLDGPPLPAPPSFTGLALAGLAALRLLREHPDA